MNHGDHDMSPRCSMHMLWNTQIIDTCIVFPQWHIRSHASFVFSFLAIVALSLGYEYLRQIQKSLDRRIAASLATKGKARSRSPLSGRSTPDRLGEEVGLLGGSKKGSHRTQVPTVSRAMRALLYGATVFLSFFLMLVFMTYNAYLILAVVIGAALGHYVFGGYIDVDAVLAGSPEGRSLACH